MKIIVANWKMNGNFDLVDEFIRKINSANSENKVVICPPALLIGRFSQFHCDVGAQNCFWEESGAFTGENSPRLLKECGCQYVILGHSERRSIFHESDEVVYKKWKAATAQKLIPITCIGENLQDRKRWRDVIAKQLNPFLNESLRGAIFAYEPVWSIGTGTTPTHEEIESIFEFIRELLGDGVSLLYGGSVTSNNSAQILKCRNVDGLLVGGASLKIDEFKKIICNG
ncbi:MAG: triose-phosphate isomerase [Holosporaceae bacterium]|nr:triose-phosphate isomerase [Holosporaceae bacterium]